MLTIQVVTLTILLALVVTSVASAAISVEKVKMMTIQIETLKASHKRLLSVAVQSCRECMGAHAPLNICPWLECSCEIREAVREAEALEVER